MPLSSNRRIFLNIMATYGRSVFALICGLLTGRWSLMVLGEVDLGLFGVIGGLTLFINFFNSVLSISVSRFYAHSIGEAQISPVNGLLKCRQWFNTALLVHTVIPLCLMLIGYPIGVFAIRSWLTIPLARMEACVWVFRFSCVSCLVGMMLVPYSAMFYAKQYIAELTMVQLLTTIFHVCVLYYMLKHPGIWLTKYAFIHCIYGLLPSLLIWLRSLYVFPECKFNLRFLWNKSRILQIVNFAGWQFFGCLGALLRGQGIAILVNKCFGPSVNASNSIANQLASQTQTLSASLSGAFSPAINTACGAKDFVRMRTLAYMTCRIGTLLILMFALPLILEINEVLLLWLKNPPEYVSGLCLGIIGMLILDRISYGHMLAVNAVGKIALYQAVLGTCLILTLPFAGVFVWMGLGVYSICYAMILTMALCSVGRAWFARKLTGMSMRYWLERIVTPLAAISALSLLVGILPRFWMSESFIRVIVTTLMTNAVVFTLAWGILLSEEERIWLRNKCHHLLGMKR